MSMPPPLRKFALTVHLTCSLGWIGAVIVYLALVLAALTTPDADTLRSAWSMMEVSALYVIVPLAIGSLVTGLLMALGTKWGLFRHYWVLISFGLTVFAAGVLVQHIQTIRSYAALAAEPSTSVAVLRAGLSGELLHAGVGLIVLLVIQVLNVYKPQGLTPYGWRILARRGASDVTNTS